MSQILVILAGAIAALESALVNIGERCNDITIAQTRQAISDLTALHASLSAGELPGGTAPGDAHDVLSTFPPEVTELVNQLYAHLADTRTRAANAELRAQRIVDLLDTVAGKFEVAIGAGGVLLTPAASPDLVDTAQG